MKRKKVFALMILCVICFSCSNFKRDKPVNKAALPGNDYRLFQVTPAWALAKAVEDGDEKLINELSGKAPGLINYKEPKYGNTLLMLSVSNQQLKAFKALLDLNADVNIHNTFDGASAIITACSSKYYDIDYVQLLVKHGANVNDVETGKRKRGNSTRRTPLMAAAQTGRLDLVKFLISRGADINYYNEYGQSSLSKSVMVNKYEVAYYLLQNGADFKRPIFYKPDYSVPAEKQDPTDSGKPMYLVDVMKQQVTDTYTNEDQYKTLIVEFLKSKGVKY